MAAPLRLMALFLLMLPSPLRKYLSVSHHRPKEALHPIVLVPGASCPNIEVRLTEPYMPSVPRCGAMKGTGWFELWVNASDVLAHDYVECFKEQMSLIYDPVSNDYRNLPGVETRVPNFGSARGFRDKEPLHPEYCLTVIRETLERIGYHDGETLFGAPYDLRHAPPVPSQQPSEVFSVYFKRMTLLLEDASKKNKGKKAIIFGHSYGGMVALEFVNSKPLAWRNKYIKHLILVAPTLPEGFMEPLRNLISGTDILYLPRTSPLYLRPTWRSFESALVDLPSQAVFGHEPLLITKQRNYSAYDIEDLLTAIGFGEGIQPFKRRAVPKTQSFQAPMVPVTCINGVGNRTPRQLIYWDGDFDASPEFVYGDGDGKINLISMLAFDEKMRQHPGQRKQFKSIKLDGAQHSNIVTVEWALRRVMQEIHEANWISS
ncbi:unnamed protein product [Urochloa decumbens]|uniref:Lecithin-cholesterol acyltransferase-like 1 n=1 Tax=Urochloa decumbens TaxID=240449 RepID=A0ABC9BTT2_9POAL